MHLSSICPKIFSRIITVPLRNVGSIRAFEICYNSVIEHYTEGELVIYATIGYGESFDANDIL